MAQARCHDIDKSWHALGHLLHRLDFPVDVVYGEEAVPVATGWGYEAPLYLAPT